MTFTDDEGFPTTSFIEVSGSTASALIQTSEPQPGYAGTGNTFTLGEPKRSWREEGGHPFRDGRLKSFSVPG